LRAFRLDRIIGRPSHAGEAGSFVVPEDADVLSLVSGPAGEPLEVVLRVGEAARWAVVARGGSVTDEDPGPSARMRIADIDMVRDRAWLLGLAPDAVVVAPDAVRDGLIQAFEDLIRLHADAGAMS
jgi:predicted DNA-binding transcriptional regulator YafY